MSSSHKNGGRCYSNGSSYNYVISMVDMADCPHKYTTLDTKGAVKEIQLIECNLQYTRAGAATLCCHLAAEKDALALI